MPFGPSFFRFNCEQRWMWIVILSLVSKKKGQPIVWESGFIENTNHVSPSTQDRAITMFIDYGMLTFVTSSNMKLHEVTLSNILVTCPTDIQTNKQTHEQTKPGNRKTSSNKFDYSVGFLEVYDAYPRREGKQAGYKIYQREIITQELRTDLLTAIQNYRKRKSGTETRFLLMFGTFMNQWKDWLDAETGSSQEIKKKVPFYDFRETSE